MVPALPAPQTLELNARVARIRTRRVPINISVIVKVTLRYCKSVNVQEQAETRLEDQGRGIRWIVQNTARTRMLAWGRGVIYRGQGSGRPFAKKGTRNGGVSREFIQPVAKAREGS
jgi:hypothetical protein